MKEHRTYLTLLLITASLGACTTTNNATAEAESSSSTATATVTVTTADPVETKDLEELYWKRIEDAKMNFTQAEVDFMTGMIGHHAQALIMSELAPDNGASLPVRRLASRIINAQKDEIKSMQNWLKDRGQPVPEVHIDGLNLMIHGAGGHGAHANHGGMDNMGEMNDMDGMDHSSMPGMLTQDQLVELSEAKGTEFDEMFLTYMIQHHGGAITMVNDLLDSEKGIQDEAAFKLASEINVDQRTEIERMHMMLADITASK
jgi:uncharacterized protein (DUF305 family)